MELLIIYIPFQFYVYVRERRNPQYSKGRSESWRFLQCQGFSSSGSAWLVTWGSQSHDVMLRVVLLSSLYPLSENKNQSGSTSPSVGLAEPALQLALIELAWKQLMESQLLSLNGQFYCILMENVIIGRPCFTENTFLSFLLLFSLVANCK